MRIRHSTSSGNDQVQLQMTPMIDIVFQLLIFFIMTFRIVAQEGDFNIEMPLAAPSEGLPDDIPLPPMELRIQASPNGDVSNITLNNRSIADWDQLRSEIIRVVGDDRGPSSAQESAEIKLDVDYGLHYKHVVNAITAVSGYKVKGNVVTLVENINFAPPRTP